MYRRYLDYCERAGHRAARRHRARRGAGRLATASVDGGGNSAHHALLALSAGTVTVMPLATFGQWAFVIGLILGGFVVVLFMTSGQEKEHRQLVKSEEASREDAPSEAGRAGRRRRR